MHNKSTSVSFSIVELSSNLAHQTLPLVRATWPAVDLATWRAYVEHFSTQAAPKVSGVHGLRDSGGCFCGIYVYELDRDLLLGPVLAVHLFTTVDIANSPRTVRALLDTAETQAIKLGCMGMRVRLRNSQVELASKLHCLGLTPEAQFHKKVALRPSPN
jgi:hypothetical protein